MDKHEGMQPGDLNAVSGAPSPAERDQGNGGATAPAEEPSITTREWWIHNGPVLLIVIAGLIFLFTKFDSRGLLSIAKLAIGLSLVVFLHELGHFMAAKWCDVNVSTFSIGFGPTIPGCSFKWGETNYRLALFPLGGYVQMLGQVDGDEASDGSEDDPRSYRNKTVGQRMLIISAGVIMNVILAVVCFVVVFRGPGKDRIAGVIGAVDTGTPAFTNGLRSGAEILQIGDVKSPYFENLMVRVMAAMRGEKLDFISKRPDDSVAQDLKIQPRKDNDKGDKKFVIGIAHADSTQLLIKRYAPTELKNPAALGSAAAKAPFEFGDRIVGTTDPDDPSKVKELRDDPRFPGHGRRDFFELAKRLQRLAGKPIVVRVERGTDKKAHTVDVTLPPTFHHNLGVRMQMGHITAKRNDSPAAKAGVLITRKNDDGRVLRGDLIQKVSVKEPGGAVTTYEDETLDPVRLPFDLRQWAERMDKAKQPLPWKVTLTVGRDRDFERGHAQTFESKVLELEWDNSWRFDRMIAMDVSSPQAIPELGLAYQIKSIVAGRLPGAKSDDLRHGDVIREVRPLDADGEPVRVKKIPLKEEDEQWACVAEVLQSPGVDKVALKVWRNQKEQEIIIRPTRDESWPISDNGLIYMTDMRKQTADTMAQAVGLGLSDTWDNMKQVFQNVRGMILGTISPDNLAGPITIARLGYKIVSMDFWEFVFFLGMISVNLAVINFLPIPVLDGGHMVFLVYEKLWGKPAPEAVRVGATYAGLALILCLFIFVTFLDFSRL